MALEFRNIFFEFCLSLILLLQISGYLTDSRNESENYNENIFNCYRENSTKVLLLFAFYITLIIQIFSFIIKIYIKITTKLTKNQKRKKRTINRKIILITNLFQIFANTILLLELIINDNYLPEGNYCKTSSMTFFVILFAIFVEYFSNLIEIVENIQENRNENRFIIRAI